MVGKDFSQVMGTFVFIIIAVLLAKLVLSGINKIIVDVAFSITLMVICMKLMLYIYDMEG